MIVNTIATGVRSSVTMLRRDMVSTSLIAQRNEE